MNIITAQKELVFEKVCQSIYDTWGLNPILEHLKAVIKEKERVIVLGCGSGYATAKISSMTKGLVAGIDASELLVARAKKDFGGQENLNFFHWDPLKEIPGIQADWVICLNRINFLTSPTQIAQLFRYTERMLRKFGRGVFLTMHPAAPKEHWPQEKPTKRYGCVAMKNMLRKAWLQIETSRRLWVDPPAYGSPVGRPPTYWMFQVKRRQGRA